MTELSPVKSRFSTDTHLGAFADPVDDPLLSVAAAARALRISPTTLRRYIKDYKGHVDIIRDGRTVMIAVSSIPALAQIRDLRARKFSPEDVEQLLAALPGQATLASHAASIEAGASAAVKDAVDAALGDIRKELAGIKQASQDSELVDRQSLANILFLIDKFSKELQYHASEERIANNERDRLLTRNEVVTEKPSIWRNSQNKLPVTATNLYRRLSGTLV